MIQSATQNHYQHTIRSFADPINVAIVEDDNAIQNLIATSLLSTLDNVNIMKFKNGREAIHELWEKDLTQLAQLDGIFLDIYLEDKTSGLDILDYCQYLPKNIPIVLMSAYFNGEHLNSIAQLERDPILMRKPFFPQDIINLSQWVFELDTKRRF